MGTLDDAIREHLELKRRQGASDEELERKQAEVLGRGPAAPEPSEPAEAPHGELERPPESGFPAEEGQPKTEIVAEPDLPAVDPETGRNGFSEQVAEAPVEAAAPGTDDLFDQDLVERGGSPPPEPTVRRASRPEAEPEPEPDLAEPPEDFLEDTPEFLEETPEHDRLWFEQRPPKDFNFD